MFHKVFHGATDRLYSVHTQSKETFEILVFLHENQSCADLAPEYLFQSGARTVSRVLDTASVHLEQFTI